MAKKEKEKKQASILDDHRVGRIMARIIDEKNGLRLLRGVGAVRIRSKDYSLLIMDDYMPALGKVDGSVIFLTEEGEVSFRNIVAFYKHQHNEFTLLIKEQAQVEEAPQESEATP